MHRRVAFATAVIVGAAAFAVGWLAGPSAAKTKGGCTDAQVCCRYMDENGTTALDCMDAKACADKGGKEIPDKSKCAE